jgi:hypothetical protein
VVARPFLGVSINIWKNTLFMLNNLGAMFAVGNFILRNASYAAGMTAHAFVQVNNFAPSFFRFRHIKPPPLV